MQQATPTLPLGNSQIPSHHHTPKPSAYDEITAMATYFPRNSRNMPRITPHLTARQGQTAKYANDRPYLWHHTPTNPIAA